MSPKKRRKTSEKRTTMNLSRKTLVFIDEIADSFEEFVSRGEVVDMMATYIEEEDLEDEVFGEAEEFDDEDEEQEDESDEEEEESEEEDDRDE